ncbi:MAG: hypothetical protein ACTHK7_03230, partial [Aureliella sp.]
MEIAKRWGYDFDRKSFIVHMRDDAPTMACKVECSTESGNFASFTAVTGPGAEIEIPIAAKEGEGVRARFLQHGKEIDSVWVRTAKVTCPRCGRRIDRLDDHRDDAGQIEKRPAEHFLYRMPQIKWSTRSDRDYRSLTFSSPFALLKVTRFYDEGERRWGSWVASVEYDERNDVAS